jgi:hypothetical protein
MKHVHQGGVLIAILVLVGAFVVTGSSDRTGVSAQPSTPTPILAAPNSLPPERNLCRHAPVTNNSPTGSLPLIATVTTDQTTYAMHTPVTFTIIITNQSDAPVTVALQRASWLYTLTVSNESGGVVWEWPTAVLAIGGTCTFGPHQQFVESVVWSHQFFPPVDGQRALPGRYTVTARVVGVADVARAAFTISDGTASPTPTATPTRTEVVALFPGCNNISLTWPVGTALRTVVENIVSTGALRSVFRYDNASGQFFGFSPSAPDFVNDYTAITARFEPVFVCIDAPGTLTRPTM